MTSPRVGQPMRPVAAAAAPSRPTSDLARIGGRARTDARPGPGPIADRLVRQLELTLDRRVGGQMSGDHLGVGHGTGLELDRLRPYEPGDDVRKIDWNATARTLVPQVREDVPDRQLTAWLLLDHSPSMHFGTADRRKADVAEGAALVVGRFAARRGNRLGVVTFGAGREDVTPPKGGSRGMLGLLRAVATEPAEEGGGETSPARALGIVGAIRTTPGVVVIVSDFRGPRDWIPALTEVAGRHAVIALEIVDPREESLVDVGELTLIDPETGRTLRVDTGDRRLRTAFDEAAAADRTALAREFRRLGVRHLRLSTDGPWLPALAQGFTRTPDRTGHVA
ncbi:MAG: DUF58 domain-containing protein [Chloroflexota bacterium]